MAIINNTNNTTTLSAATLNYFATFNAENCTSPDSDNNNWFWNFEYLRYEEDGSIVCKASEEALNTAETRSLAVALMWENGFDFVLSGEDGCMSNYDMYTPLVNTYTGIEYLIPYSVSEEFAEGKEVRIYGRVLTPEELVEAMEYGNQ